MKIVTITLNPALDLTTRLEAMSLGFIGASVFMLVAP